MMKKLENPAVGLLVMRMIVGVIFIVHGYGKITGIDGVIGFFASFGIPALFAYLVTASELLGGIALVLGFYTRISALVLSIVMLGALVFVHAKVGGAELPFALLASLLGIAFLGAGKYSLDAQQTRM